MASRIADERILIIDFGAQYAQLIARRIRELRVYCEIVRHDIPWEHVQARNAKGLIFSGGPGSVYDTGAPKCDPRLMSGEIPVLGICYGMQLACDALGGRVDSAPSREYGRARCQIVQPNLLLKGVSAETDVWMSHGDIVSAVPAGFEALATTSNSPIAAVKHTSLPVYGLQFHPEVTHTTEGTSMLRNFAYEVCGCAGTWELSDLIKESVEEIKSKVGSNRVICGLSGGVDSSVTAALISKAIGPQLSCILVDHGLLRQNEQQTVIDEFSSHFRTDLHVVDAKERFLSSLRGITEPQEKRRRIGQAFIECFKAEAVNIADSKFLAQGTLYPDVIESGAAPDGPAATIKLHHNVGGLPDELGFELIEPLRNLFKDEVRRMGTQLGLPDEIVWKHPFPGPGLAVRCLGEVTEARLDVLRQADAIVVGEIKDANLYRETSQVFAVLLPVQSVGVMGDCRTYEDTIIVRCVNTDDFMTADWTRLPYDLLAKISSRIINEVVGVNRVAYDISSKPPATIEWE